MNFSQKNYHFNFLLFVFLFIKMFIFTCIVSLTFFHNLILIKCLLIRIVYLLLNKYKVFSYIFSFLIGFYLWYSNYFIGVNEKNSLNEMEEEKVKDKTDSEMSYTTFILLGIVTISITMGIPFLNHFYPEAIPAMKGAAAAVGATILSGLQGIYQSISEVSVSASDGLNTNKPKLINWEAAKANAPNAIALYAVSQAELAYGVIKEIGVAPEHYHGTINLLLKNKVPCMFFIRSDRLLNIIGQMVNNNSGKALFKTDLTDADLIFYDIMLSINPK